MNWLKLFGKRVQHPSGEVAPESLEIALLPLAAVLFPGGLLSLKLSEPKYLEMVTACARSGMPFGVCLSVGAKNSESNPEPNVGMQGIGTLAHAEVVEALKTDHLALTVRGGRRFRVLAEERRADGLLHARVELLDEPSGVPVPERLSGLLPLLHKVVADLGREKIPEPHEFDDAAWVGYRLTEVVPVQLMAKQKLLELDDPVSRLEILHKYFAQRNLLT